MRSPCAESLDCFDTSVALSDDTLVAARLMVVVGAFDEHNRATGMGGDQGDNSLAGADAIYIFR